MHARTQIRNAVETALSGLSVTVYIERRHRLDAGDLPAVLIHTGESQVETDQMVTGEPYHVETTQQLVVELHAAGPDGRNVCEAIDALELELEAALAVDVTLGGILENLVAAGSQFEASVEQESVIAVRAVQYEAIWRHQFGAPDTPEG